MFRVPGYDGMAVGVFGLARSGLASLAALKASGAEVHAWDDKAAAREAARQAGAVVEPIDGWPWTELKALVLSPGVPLTHPAPHDVVMRARAANVEILGDVELFARALPPKGSDRPRIIGITGTNGKSTTTVLTGHLLRRLGYSCEVGGNIGEAVLGLGPLPASGSYVLELSSFQLDLTFTLAPDVAVLLNITPDHLDRHGDMAGYQKAKARIFDGQGEGDTAIFSVDDPYSEEIGADLAARHNGHGARVVPLSVGKALGRGIYVIDGVLYDNLANTSRRVADLSGARCLRGPHNWQNAAAAYAAIRDLDGDGSRIEEAFASFTGLAHRMEEVGRKGSIVFINDSKATNAEASAQALASFSCLYWIAGGVAKADGITPLAPHFDRIKRAYLIGEAAPAFAGTLKGKVDHVLSGDLASAVSAAARDAEADGGEAAVLFSPAAASFDQYTNFEERGDHFRELVREAGADKGEAA